MTTLPWGRPLTPDDLDRLPWLGAQVELVDGSLRVARAGTPFTRAELDLMPDDGHRYELIDGEILVTPSPSLAHQQVSLELALLLAGSCHLVCRSLPHRSTWRLATTAS